MTSNERRDLRHRLLHAATYNHVIAKPGEIADELAKDGATRPKEAEPSVHALLGMIQEIDGRSDGEESEVHEEVHEEVIPPVPSDMPRNALVELPVPPPPLDDPEKPTFFGALPPDEHPEEAANHGAVEDGETEPVKP